MTDECILRLPTMSNPEKLAAIHVFSIILTYAFLLKQDLLPFIAERVILLTLDNGISSMSGIGFALYGALLTW